jgi:hypothetical protein
MAKNQDLGSGINIPDPQLWYKLSRCDPGSIPGGGNLNVCLQLGSRVLINIMHLFLHPPTPPQVHNVESRNLLEI